MEVRWPMVPVSGEDGLCPGDSSVLHAVYGSSALLSKCTFSFYTWCWCLFHCSDKTPCPRWLVERSVYLGSWFPGTNRSSWWRVMIDSGRYCSISGRNLRAHILKNQQKKEGTEHRISYWSTQSLALVMYFLQQGHKSLRLSKHATAQRTCAPNLHWWHVPPPVNYPGRRTLLL